MSIEYLKISELDEASALDGTETLEGVQSGASVKLMGQQLSTFILDGIISISESGSNSNGEYEIWSNGRVEITMWGFVTGDGVNWFEGDLDNALPTPVTSVRSINVNVSGFKGSDPADRWDSDGPSSESANGSFDGTNLDVFVFSNTEVAIGSGVRILWTASLIGQRA